MVSLTINKKASRVGWWVAAHALNIKLNGFKDGDFKPFLVDESHDEGLISAQIDGEGIINGGSNQFEEF